jgi:hypothetical protein
MAFSFFLKKKLFSYLSANKRVPNPQKRGETCLLPLLRHPNKRRRKPTHAIIYGESMADGSADIGPSSPPTRCRRRHISIIITLAIVSPPALYYDGGGGAPDGGSVSSGGSGGVVGSGRPSTIGITTNKTTTATRMIAAIMMNVMAKVLVIDIYYSLFSLLILH